MKTCPQCNKNEIEDKYSMCMSCLNDTKKANKKAPLKTAKEKRQAKRDKKKNKGL